MGSQVRLTFQTLQVLGVLLDDPNGEHFGLEISRESGLPTGSIYPILTRLETAGWLASSWEEIDESTEGRRRRRYYRLTAEGADNARRELEKAQQILSRSPRPRLQHGGASA